MNERTQKKTQEFGGDKLMPLLGERLKLQERIGILEGKKNEVSEQVYLRVRNDYIAKLESLSGEIGRHRQTLEATRKDYEELLGKLGNAIELGGQSLEELKIRYALGEYTREEMDEIGREKKKKIEYYIDKKETYRKNIERLESVLDKITGRVD